VFSGFISSGDARNACTSSLGTIKGQLHNVSNLSGRGLTIHINLRTSRRQYIKNTKTFNGPCLTTSITAYLNLKNIT